MKRLTTFIALSVALAGCSASTAQASPTISARTVVHQSDLMALVSERQMAAMVNQVKTRIGKTWYVFSGDTPAGWDCSGLVRWAYEQIGIELPHSANKQGHLGHWVKTPQIGDIVVFGYPGTSTFFHSSLYAGNGMVIHAGFQKGMTTALISLSSAAFKGSVIRFVRIIG